VSKKGTEEKRKGRGQGKKHEVESGKSDGKVSAVWLGLVVVVVLVVLMVLVVLVLLVMLVLVMLVLLVLLMFLLLLSHINI
jgi:uncharacterized membrane protein